MKRLLIALAASLCLVAPAAADEGMWLLPLLEKINAQAIKDLGCRLTPDQIYSINHSSLKDAVVQFGGGCTGEIISGQGLLVTNHHCGYSSIQGLSSPEHNYLEDGYWAMNRGEELPVPGLSVKFLVKFDDVTEVIRKAEAEFRKAFKDSARTDALVSLALRETMGQMAKEAVKANPGTDGKVLPFYNENVYYLVLYKTYKDVRFVGAPPASVGKFGGETDNWMWPRHTGDFSMFRVYAGKDNEPAEYSAENVPYTPRQFLKISLKGIKEGDYAMIMGYPGYTQRFQTADQLQHIIEEQDISIEARTIRQDIMWKFMESDPTIRLQYANKYAGSANGWKKWMGMKKAFEDLDIIGREKAKEEAFSKWVSKKKSRQERYGSALKDIAEGVALNDFGGKAARLFSETLLKVELLDLAEAFASAWKEPAGDSAAALEQAIKAMGPEYEDYCEPLDREVSAAMLKLYRDRAAKENYPDLSKSFGVDFATMDIDKFIDDLFSSSVFASKEKLEGAYREGMGKLREDPAGKLIRAYSGIILSLADKFSPGSDQIRKGSKAFGAGLMEWQKKEPSYPDANFTMRLTYGTVKAYSPRDAVYYNYFTTLDGVMQKEDPDNYEFRVPAKLQELYYAKDFGRYAAADGRLPVCFLTNCDITGGNSGSPVMNADGELIGLAFDGNWESMSSDVMYEPNLQRCICVDIRYVLFLVDKLGGAQWLLKEMEIAQ